MLGDRNFVNRRSAVHTTWKNSGSEPFEVSVCRSSLLLSLNQMVSGWGGTHRGVAHDGTVPCVASHIVTNDQRFVPRPPGGKPDRAGVETPHAFVVGGEGALIAATLSFTLDLLVPGRPTHANPDKERSARSFTGANNRGLRRGAMRRHCARLTTGSKPIGMSITKVGLTGRSGIARPKNSRGPMRRISSASPASRRDTFPRPGTTIEDRPLRPSLTFILDQI
jgi:hypothetical protein